MITKTSDFSQKMQEKTVVKDAYSPQKIKKAVIWGIWGIWVRRL